MYSEQWILRIVEEPARDHRGVKNGGEREQDERRQQHGSRQRAAAGDERQDDATDDGDKKEASGEVDITHDVVSAEGRSPRHRRMMRSAPV